MHFIGCFGIYSKDFLKTQKRHLIRITIQYKTTVTFFSTKHSKRHIMFYKKKTHSETLKSISNENKYQVIKRNARPKSIVYTLLVRNTRKPHREQHVKKKKVERGLRTNSLFHQQNGHLPTALVPAVVHDRPASTSTTNNKKEEKSKRITATQDLYEADFIVLHIITYVLRSTFGGE